MLLVENLCVSFQTRAGAHLAVDKASFLVPCGKTVGLVGESGSGKTTIGRAILKLIPAQSGTVCFEGASLLPMKEREFKSYRKDIQLIFQDPYGSLNPRLSIFQIVSEPMEIHFPSRSKSERQELTAELLRRVGLSPDAMKRLPHEFSGGQRQRIGIARALAVEPKLIICDEPVSALDVSVQAQIVNLLQDLQDELGLSYLFIAHDLAVVEHISHHVLVLHHGVIVESAPAGEIYQNPRHEYTKKLLAAVPSLA